jgi:hypothetical protein
VSDDFEEQDWVKVGVAAELTKQYAADQRALLESLATMLESAFPNETVVVRKGGLFSKKTPAQIKVRFGEYSYNLEDTGRGPLRASQTKIVRGIALKTEEIPVEDWLVLLGEELEGHTRNHARAREALSKFVG